MACKGKLVLVTVGTTKFDALIKGVDTLTLLSCLHAHGYSELLVQQGKGTYRISNIFPSPVPEVNVQVEDYLTNLADIIAKASLVITHAGAGSIFESLTYQVSCTPDTVEDAVHQISVHRLDPYQGGNARPIAREIESLFEP